MAARRNTMRLRRHQKKEIRRPRPTVRNCSFLAVGGLRHWFHLYHRTRTLPLPSRRDQNRFLLCRNTTFFRGKRRNSGPGFKSGIPPVGALCPAASPLRWFGVLPHSGTVAAADCRFSGEKERIMRYLESRV